MPKNKTHSGTKKRFRSPAPGKLMREQAPALATSWSTSPRPRNRRLASDQLSPRHDVKRIKKLLGR